MNTTTSKCANWNGCSCVGASPVLCSWSNTSSVFCLGLPWPSTCFSTDTAWKQRSGIGQGKIFREMCILPFDHEVAKKGDLYCRFLKFFEVISLLPNFLPRGRNLSLCFLFFQNIWKFGCTFPCISDIVNIFISLLKNMWDHDRHVAKVWHSCVESRVRIISQKY